MTAEQAQATFLSVLKDYGFATVVAIACLYFGRQDLMLPLVRSHTQFLDAQIESGKKIADAQGDIAQALQDQTRLLQEQSRLLYALQPRVAQGEAGDAAP